MRAWTPCATTSPSGRWLCCRRRPRTSRPRRRTLGTWGRPARIFPVLGHQARAVAVVAGEGSALADTASRATVEANTDDLRFEDGAIDLDLVEGFEDPLDDAYRALARASHAGRRSPHDVAR